MLLTFDLWGALMVPLLFGDARQVAVYATQSIEARDTEGPVDSGCGLGRVRLLVGVTAEGVEIGLSRHEDVALVARRRDGAIDAAGVTGALERQRRYFYGGHDVMVGVDPFAAGVTYQDLVSVVDAAAAVGFARVELTTLEDLDDRRDATAGRIEY